jgi:tetratricopeptide (TPR) repeat protein
MPLTLKRIPLVLLFTAAIAAIVLVAVVNRDARGIGTEAAAAPAAARMPSDPRALEELALAQIQLAREDGDPTRYGIAEELLRRALRADPNDFIALGGLGSIAASRHDFPTALSLGRRALSLDPASGYALGVVVDAQIELGRYAAARRSIVRMLDLHPDLSSFSRLSYYLELHGDITGARRALRAAIASGAPARENTAWAYLSLGNLELGQGNLAAAEAQYGLAGRAQRGFVHALAGRARVAAARGRHDEAIRLYRSVTARLPLPAYVIALGDAQTAAGQTADARAGYELVRAEERLYGANGVNVDVELALFEADHGGDATRAVSLVRAAQRTQRSVAVDDALAWTLFRAGQYRAALEAANRALRLGTRDATFLYHRGAINAALGRRGDARADLSRALLINPQFSVLGAPDARRLLKEVSR